MLAITIVLSSMAVTLVLFGIGAWIMKITS